MPEVRIPLKDPSGKIDPATVPDVPRFPNAVAAGSGKVPVSTSAGGWDYVTQGDTGGDGGTIAATRYAPATVATKTASTTSLVALDAALLSVSFTAPATGKVQVELSGVTHGSATSTRTYWGLVDGAVPVADSLVMVHEGTTPDRAGATIIVTGLTPGQNYTWAWAAAASSGTTTLTAGGSSVDAATGGQATIVVRESPFG